MVRNDNEKGLKMRPADSRNVVTQQCTALWPTQKGEGLKTRKVVLF